MSDGVQVWFEGGPLAGLIGSVADAPLAYRHYYREDDQWWSVLYMHSDRTHNGFPSVVLMSKAKLVP